MKIRPVEAELFPADWRTDRHDEANFDVLLTVHLSIFILVINQLKIRNNIIKEKMNVTRSLLEDIKTKQLKCYGPVQRMVEGRLPKKL